MYIDVPKCIYLLMYVYKHAQAATAGPGKKLDIYMLEYVHTYMHIYIDIYTCLNVPTYV